MRAEEIKAATLEAGEQAHRVIRRMARTEEVAEYERRVNAVGDFWRTATPEFCHAWLEATLAEADVR